MPFRYGPMDDWETDGWVIDVWAKDIWVTWAGRLGDSVGWQSINIIDTVIWQVICKARVNVIQQNPLCFAEIFRSVWEPEVWSMYAEHLFSHLFRGSHSLHGWKRFQMTWTPTNSHRLKQSSRLELTTSGGYWRLVALCTRRGACRRQRQRGAVYC